MKRLPTLLLVLAVLILGFILGWNMKPCTTNPSEGAYIVDSFQTKGNIYHPTADTSKVIGYEEVKVSLHNKEPTKKANIKINNIRYNSNNSKGSTLQPPMKGTVNSSFINEGNKGHEKHIREPTVTIETDSCDSVRINIPITQKVYTGPQYKAYVSGYKPQLDSLTIIGNNYYYRNKEKEKKWCIGISGGLGTNGKELTPFIGITITRSLIRF